MMLSAEQLGQCHLRESKFYYYNFILQLLAFGVAVKVIKIGIPIINILKIEQFDFAMQFI